MSKQIREPILPNTGSWDGGWGSLVGEGREREKGGKRKGPGSVVFDSFSVGPGGGSAMVKRWSFW